MTEIDRQPDNPQPAEQQKKGGGGMTRRRFLTFTFAGATAIGLGAIAAPMARFAYPIVPEEVFAKVKVASKSQLTPLSEGVSFDYQEIPSQLIQLDEENYAAYSLVCTHLGCIVKWVARDAQFFCPCHAGIFSPEGEVLAGPPPRPLTKLIVAVEGSDIFVEGIEPEEE